MTQSKKFFNIINDGLDNKMFESVIELTQNIPAHQHLNIKISYLAPGKAKLNMLVGPEFSNSYGIAHGGIIATLVDSAMGVAIRTLNLRVVTVEMNLNFFSRVEVEENLTVNAWTVHVGSKMVVAEAEVFNSKNKRISKSRATFFRVGKVIPE